MPFAETGWLALRSPKGASIWYWDRAQLKSILGAHDPTDISPESVWRPDGDGWRILTCAEGYEAQYWEGGALAASTWRRNAFSPEQWTAFVLSVESAATEGPDAPPVAIETSLDNTTWRRTVIKRPLGWRDLEHGAYTVALCALALTAFFGAQGFRRQAMADAERASLERIEARVAGDERAKRARSRLELVRAYQEIMQPPAVLGAVADAFAVLDANATVVTAWAADREALSLVIEAPESPVRDLVGALERTPHLCDVSPEIGGGANEVEIRATIAPDESAPCSAAGGGS